MLINFTKMHSLGNDFVVVDTIRQAVKLHSSHIKRIADRKLGIGCDQVLLLEPPINPTADLFYRIFNANGQEAEQCANGARCVARFAIDSGLVNKPVIIADCCSGQLTLSITNDNLITADFGKIKPEIITHAVEQSSLPTEIHAISIGNPHGICIVPEVDCIPVATWGKELTKLSCFPNQANITFMQVINKTQVKLQVYERGAGPTLACGSGAAAAVLVGQHLGLLEPTVTTNFTQGNLTISTNNESGDLQMSGPADSVFIGSFRV